MSANEPAPLSGAQCRAARAMTDVSRTMLSEASGVGEDLIRDFEQKLLEPGIDACGALRKALEAFGAVFLDSDSHGGPGVRLKFTINEAARIDRLENEGGRTGDDDVAG
jgi:hypothetical protein